MGYVVRELRRARGYVWALYGAMYGAMHGAMYGAMYGAMCRAMCRAMYGAMCGAHRPYTKGSFGRQSTIGLGGLLLAGPEYLSAELDHLTPVRKSMGLTLRLISRLSCFVLSLSAEAMHQAM